MTLGGHNPWIRALRAPVLVICDMMKTIGHDGQRRVDRLVFLFFFFSFVFFLLPSSVSVVETCPSVCEVSKYVYLFARPTLEDASVVGETYSVRRAVVPTKHRVFLFAWVVAWPISSLPRLLIHASG